MPTTAVLVHEFQHETATTRRHLERLTENSFGWRPHQKSFTAGELASHLVECVGWGSLIVEQEEVDINPSTWRPFIATSSAQLLSTFEEHVAAGNRALTAATEQHLAGLWRLKVKGKTRFEGPRSIVLRDFSFSHMIHHRGQFSVYLRLLDIPVPGSYGPTADEQS